MRTVLYIYFVLYFGFVAIMLIGDLPMFKNFHGQPPYVRGCVMGVLSTWEGMNNVQGNDVKVTKTEVDTANRVCKVMYEKDSRKR